MGKYKLKDFTKTAGVALFCSLFSSFASAQTCPVQQWNHFAPSEISRVQNGVIDFEGTLFTRIDPATVDSSPLDWWSSHLNLVDRSLRGGLRQGILRPYFYQARSGAKLAVTFVPLTKTLNANLGLIRGAIRVFGAVEINGQANGFLAVCTTEEAVIAVF